MVKRADKIKFRIKKMKGYARKFLEGRVGSGICSCCKKEKFGTIRFIDNLAICVECLGRIYLRAKYMGKLPDLEGLDMTKLSSDMLQKFAPAKPNRKKRTYVPTPEEIQEMGGGRTIRKKAPKDRMFSWDNVGDHGDGRGQEEEELEQTEELVEDGPVDLEEEL